MTGEAPETTPQRNRLVTSLSTELIERVLLPYLPASRLVQSAQLDRPRQTRMPESNDPDSWLRLDAQCAVTTPCYIEDTGHFNAVELNITYNQMLYLCLAETLRLGLIPKPAWDLEDFFKSQLPNVLIVDYQARFRRPMTSARYQSWLQIESIRVQGQRNRVRLQTRCAASNDGNDANEAQVSILLVDWPSA